MNASNPTVNVTFSIMDDSVFEPNETLFVNLGFSFASLPGVTLDPTSAEVIILGDDVPVIGFFNTRYTINEDDGIVTMMIGVLTDGLINIEVSLVISLLSGSAKVNSDYINDLSSGGLIVVDASNPTVNISFSLMDDSVFEPIMTLFANLRFSVDAHPHVILDPASAEVIILDDDVPIIGFINTPYTVNEDDALVTMMIGVISGDLQIEVPLLITLLCGSANVNSDYINDLSSGGLLVVNASNPTVNVSFSLVDDSVFERNETLFANLSFSVDALSGVILANASAVVVILDDDVTVIGFINTPYTVKEDDGLATMMIGVLSGDMSNEVSILISLLNGSANLFSDYMNDFSRTVVLNTSNSVMNISFTLKDDELFELSEYLSASLELSDAAYPPDVVISPSSEEIEIIILDDDVLDFRFEPVMYAVLSTLETLPLTISLFSGKFSDFGVILGARTDDNSSNSTAIAGFDFASRSYTLTFPKDGSKSQFIKVPISVDYNMARVFRVVLSFINYTNGQAVANHDSERIHLGDDAQVTVSSVLFDLVILTVVILAVIVVILGVILFKKRKFTANAVVEHHNTRSFGKDFEDNFKSYNVQSSFKLKISKHLMIDSCNLKINEPVGQGQYGIVYKGRLSKSFAKGFREVVAVKTLKGFLDKSLVRSLLEECSRMSTFEHPNVLTLTGVCVDGGPVPYIVMPFMFNGSLISYLTKEREELYFLLNSEMDEKITSASCKLMDICLQIAKGMEYLTSKRVIHRDLAARNCMVDLHLVVKVSDFGLSESINPSKDYFRQQEEGVKLPFKWMSPESLVDGIFSEKTDVWSYGVTCWEVFSAGKSPYAGVNTTDLCPMLENGYRMDKPNNAACSDIMYCEVVQKCWELKPEKRPTFSDLVPLVSSFLEANAGYLSFCDNTIPKMSTTNDDAVTMETAAVDCEESNTVHKMETTAVNKEPRYLTTKF